MDSIRLYYKLTNEAELFILDSKFDSALYSYKKSICYLPQFGTDSYNALLCAVECEKYEEAIFFTEKLVSKGIPFIFFEKQTKFHKLVQTRLWKEYTRFNPITKYNIELRSAFDTLLKADQKWRSNYNIDSIKLSDNLIHDKLWDIFKDFGYPSEELLGVSVYANNDTILDFGGSFKIILIHQIKRNPEEFINFLQQNVATGKMRNSDFMFHSKNFPQDKYILLGCLSEIQATILQLNNELYTCCCEQEAKINENRKRYFLEPLSIVRNKIEFQYEKDNRFILGKGNVGVYNSPKTEEDLKKIKKGLIDDRAFIIYKKLSDNASYID